MFHFFILTFSLFILVVFGQSSNDADQQQLAQLLNGSRVVLAIGHSQKNSEGLFLMLADSAREANLDRIYTFNLNQSSLFPGDIADHAAPKVILANGGSLSERFPLLYRALHGKTVRNWTLTITDSVATYLLVAFDSEGMPLLYNLQQNTETAWPSGSSAMASFLSEQAPSPMLISSSSEASTFYSHVQYEIDEKRGGEISGCMYALQAHHFSGQLLSSADTRLNRPLSAISLCKVGNQTSPAKMVVRVSVSCPQGECVDWQLQATFADQKRLYLIGRREVYLLENVLLESSVREGGGGALHNVTVIPLDRFFVSSSLNDSTTDAPLPLVPIVSIVFVLLLSLALISLSIYFAVQHNVCGFVSRSCQTAADSGKQIEGEIMVGYKYNNGANANAQQNNNNANQNQPNDSGGYQTSNRSSKRPSHSKRSKGRKTTSKKKKQGRSRSGKSFSSSNKKDKNKTRSSKRSKGGGGPSKGASKRE